MTAPKVIGPYEIVDLLGRGGMGEVYKAVDTRMYRRAVALKILSEAMGDDPRALSKFDLEIKTAANLRHPNIVQIYDRGEHDGRRYFAMELLEGEDLSTVILNRDRRSFEARLDIILQLCDALDYAHGQGVVHRDIKPANILVVARGGTDHVKLVDFGIAHHVAKVDQTRTAIQPGTLLYMSPEQLKDESVAPGSDLFSLGIVAYELFSGVHPFKAKTQYLASSNIMFEKHPPLRILEPSAPEALERLLDQLLQKNLSDRPASAGAVASEIKDIVRRLRAGSSDSEPPSFGNLDEMTGSMVERMVHWAKMKEAEGALVQAIEGYKRAILLAPEAQWLHTRVARLEEQLREADAPAAPVADDDDAGTSSRNRHREAFVRERMVEADAALDEGDLNRASSIAAAVLRRYSDDGQALALLDRIVLITDRGLAVKTYRQALRKAREALATGDLPSALRSCETAVAIWPDDGDVITLGREIEKLRQVELAKAVNACDDLIGRTAVAEAREALQRAEELGLEASLAVERRGAIDRIERVAREADDARQAEARRLLDEAVRGIEAAERATSGDIVVAGAGLTGARAADEGITRAAALGADHAETSALRERAGAAARSLEYHIARLEAREREARERHAREDKERGEREEAELRERREKERRAHEEQERQAREETEVREREEKERLAREETERREREEKERLAREEKERRRREEKERSGREERERQERLEREKAALKAERLRALIAKAQASFEEAHGLADSIETEADRMVGPLDEARRVVDEILTIEPDRADAKALLSRIDELRDEAGRHAENAAGLRQDAEARREARKTASLKTWLAIGGGLAFVGLAAVGVRYWLGLRHAEEQRAQEEVVTRAREDAAGKIKSSEAQIETLRRAIAGIVTDDARKSALAGCDDVSRSLDDAARLDASNVDLAQVRKDLSDVRERIGRVVIAPPPTPTGRNDVLQAAVDAIEEDLRFAGDASTKPLSALERAIQRADRGITGARDVLKSHPEEGRARTLLVELEAARPRLLERRKGLLDKRKKDLDAAAELLGKASTSAECDKVRTLLANVLRDDPEQADALRLQGRLTDVARKLEDRPGKTSGDMKSSEKPPPLPPSQPTLPQPMLRDEVESLAAKARQQPLSTEEGLLARIAANRDALRRIAAAGGAAWTSDASRAAEADLDRTLIAKLFYDFSRAVRARDLPAVFAAFPAYKGRGTLEDARAVEFELRDLAVESDLGGATATQSLRILPSAGSWKGPFIDKFRFTLRRQSDHFVIVEQKLL